MLFIKAVSCPKGFRNTNQNITVVECGQLLLLNWLGEVYFWLHPPGSPPVCPLSRSCHFEGFCVATVVICLHQVASELLWPHHRFKQPPLEDHRVSVPLKLAHHPLTLKLRSVLAGISGDKA